LVNYIIIMARNTRRRISPVIEDTEDTEDIEDSDIDSISLCSFSSCSESDFGSDFGLDLLFTIPPLRFDVKKRLPKYKNTKIYRRKSKKVAPIKTRRRAPISTAGRFRFMDMNNRNTNITDIVNDPTDKSQNQSFNVRRTLLTLESLYKTNDIKKIYSLLDEIEKLPEDPKEISYFSKEDKKLINETHTHTLQLRWIAKKLLFQWRNNKYYVESSNLNTLDLLPISELNPNETVRIYYERTHKYYVFHYKNLMDAFRMTLENQEFNIPDPKTPCNPYTNEPLTFKQLVSVFDQFNQILYKKRHCMPKTLYLFSTLLDNSVFLTNHHRYLSLKACETYIKDLTDTLFDSKLVNYLDRYYGLSICFTCIKKFIENYRQVFTPVMINYRKYLNKLIGYPSDIAMTNTIIKKYGLTITNTGFKHYLRHQRIIKTARRRLTFSTLVHRIRNGLDVSSFGNRIRVPTYSSLHSQDNERHIDEDHEFHSNTYWSVSSNFMNEDIEQALENTDTEVDGVLINFSRIFEPHIIGTNISIINRN